MAKHLKSILTILAIASFILAFIIDVTFFGQFWQDFWKSISLTRILLIILIIAATGLSFALFLFRRKKYKERIALTIPIAIIIFSLVDISKAAISYYGLDEEYNYFTAKRDIKNGKVQILETGLILPTPNVDWDKQQAAEKIAEKIFGYKSVLLGCTVTHGIGIYNNVVEDYLKEVNGQNWRIKERNMIDSLINSTTFK